VRCTSAWRRCRRKRSTTFMHQLLMHLFHNTHVVPNSSFRISGPLLKLNFTMWLNHLILNLANLTHYPHSFWLMFWMISSISCLFNRSLVEGHFPFSQKQSIVFPAHPPWIQILFSTADQLLIFRFFLKSLKDLLLSSLFHTSDKWVFYLLIWLPISSFCWNCSSISDIYGHWPLSPLTSSLVWCLITLWHGW